MRYVLLTLLLSGCAPYWVKQYPAQEVQRVIYTGNVLAYCGRPALGCWIPSAGTIVISSEVSATDRDCILAHELDHAQGWQHDDRPNYRLDCGI